MSAIWGVITQDETINIKEKEEKLRESYSHCVIDRTEYFVGDKIGIGCGIQYFTPEAYGEVLPKIDQEKEIYFTADVVLDNRDELLKRLGFSSDDRSIPDGRILYEMFHKYKEACLNELLGAYSFVYYDKKKNELFLVADATGTRSLHYYKQGNATYFSTFIEPIIEATGAKKVNEPWITDFLAMDNMAMAISYEETPYEEIYRVPASHYIKVTTDKVEKVCYWKPTVKNIKYKTDKEYEVRLKELFRTCVKCLLRNDNMTMLLSGGMDSTSVACFAAKEVAEMGKRLTSFTSVPEKDFTSKLSDYYVTDESQAVVKTQEFLAKKGYNIDCRFMDLAGRNSWDDRVEELKIMEIPYKSMQNLLWIKEGMKNSYDMGARMMLTGGYGNVTISNSFPDVYQYELIRKFHWITFIRECVENSKRYGINKRKTVKIASQLWIDSFKRKEAMDTKKVFEKSLVKIELLEKCHFEERFQKDNEKYAIASYRADKAKELIKNDKIFYQIGETQTRHSLATGVLLRDPTMDKRLIELCMSFPVACYSSGGITRRMVRKYLANELPEHVTKPRHYGLQSADTVMRIQKTGERVYKEIKAIFSHPAASQYIDVKRALEELEKLKNYDAPDKNFEILRITYTAMTLDYIIERKADGRFLS